MVGRGGYATVYLCQYKGKPLALKIIDVSVGTISSRELVLVMKEFQHEVAIQKKWNCPYLVKMIGICTISQIFSFSILLANVPSSSSLSSPSPIFS
jgi:hypothetical protein